VAVIVNDLAEYNIDGQVLKGMNLDQMVQMTSGCVCCSGVYKMGLAIQEIIETTDPTLILIETSGAAAPGPVVSELSQLGYQTDAVITLVDAEQFLSLCKREPVMAEQVAEADFLVINKVDLVTADQLAKTRRRLSRLNPRAHQIESTQGRVPSTVLFSTGMGHLRKSSGHAHADGEAGIAHFVLPVPEFSDRGQIEPFLNRLPKNIYRVKGFLRFADMPHPCLLNYACGRYTLDPFPLPVALSRELSPKTQLVFLGREMDACRQDVTEALGRCVS
jgi:G3E family GTPase